MIQMKVTRPQNEIFSLTCLAVQFAITNVTDVPKHIDLLKIAWLKNILYFCD